MPAIGYVSNIIRVMYLFFAGYFPLLIAIVYVNTIHIAYVEDDLFCFIFEDQSTIHPRLNETIRNCSKQVTMRIHMPSRPAGRPLNVWLFFVLKAWYICNSFVPQL